MVDEDLPPYLRETDLRKKQEIALELPAAPVPPPEPEEAGEEHPPDPFLRRS